MGLGETTLQTNVYVYDLDVSKTQYVFAFRTGVPDPKSDTGAGSGSSPAGLGAAGDPISAAIGLGSVFIHLRASINWHRLFESLIADFDVDALAQRQADALKVAGLSP